MIVINHNHKIIEYFINGVVLFLKLLLIWKISNNNQKVKIRKLLKIKDWKALGIWKNLLFLQLGSL